MIFETSFRQPTCLLAIAAVTLSLPSVSRAQVGDRSFIDPTGPGMTFTPWWPTQGAGAVHLMLDSSSMSEGGTSCTVSGPPNIPFDIVDAASMQVLGSGLIPAGSESVQVGLSSPLVIGHHYAARVGGQVELASRTICVRRYGFPETFSDGTRILPMYRPLNGRVGNGDFAFRITLESGSPLTTVPPPVKQVDGVMAIAARDSSGSDPVTTYQGNALLNTSVFVDVLGFVPEGSTGSVVVPVPIPDDPSLEGAVLLVQLWFVDGPFVRRSEVFGIDIDPGQGSGAAASSFGSTTTARFPGLTPGQRMLQSLCRTGIAFRAPSLLNEVFPASRK